MTRALARDVDQRYSRRRRVRGRAARGPARPCPPTPRSRRRASPRARAPAVPTDVPTTEHAVDLLEALAEEEIGRPRRRHAPRAAGPGGEAGGGRGAPRGRGRAPRAARGPDSAVPAHAGRVRGGEDRPPPFRPRVAAAQPVLRAREHPARHDRRRGRAPRARARALRLHRPGDPRDADTHRAPRAQAPGRAAARRRASSPRPASTKASACTCATSCSTWSTAARASSRFEEMAMEGATDVKAQIPPGQIILEAARRLQAPEIVTKVLGDVDRPLVMSAHARVAVQKLTLSPTDGFLLSRIDGVLTAREIFQIIPLPQEDVERSLFALLCTGTVEYGTRTVSSRGRAAEAERAPAAPEVQRAPPPAAPPAAPTAAPPAASPVRVAPRPPRRHQRRPAGRSADRRGAGFGREGRAAPHRGPRPGRHRGARPRPRPAPRRSEHPRAGRAGSRLHDDAEAARPGGRRPHGGDPRQPAGSRPARAPRPAARPARPSRRRRWPPSARRWSWRPATPRPRPSSTPRRPLRTSRRRRAACAAARAGVSVRVRT